MNYNFDEIIDRRHTNALNTDGFRGYIFHAGPEKVFAFKDEEFVRMWVADMEFGVAPEILDALRARIDRRIFGYTGLYDDEYYHTFSNWCKDHYDWHFPKEQLCISPGIIPALYQLTEMLCTAGEKVLLNTPAYGYFLHAAEYAGVDVLTSPLHKKADGTFAVDFEDFERKCAPIKIGMLKNHGYSQIKVDGYDAAVVGCEEGVFVFAPPAAVGEPWTVKQILSVPTSDAVLMDFDGDGKLELGAISPFHGASLVIYHLDAHGNYVPQWKFGKPEKETDMIHATWACQLLGKPTWIVGWRKGTKDTIAITWDGETGDYHVDYIDRNTGCANAMHFVNAKGQDVVVGTNREIDEVAMYIIEED